MNKHRLLIIEPSIDQALAIKTWVKQSNSNIELYIAHTMLDSIDLLSEIDINAILLDLELPDFQGVEPIARIRMIEPNIPIVVITGSIIDDKVLKQTKITYDLVEYVIKPIPLSHLMIYITNALLSEIKIPRFNTEYINRECASISIAEFVVKSLLKSHKILQP